MSYNIKLHSNIPKKNYDKRCKIKWGKLRCFTQSNEKHPRLPKFSLWNGKRHIIRKRKRNIRKSWLSDKSAKYRDQDPKCRPYRR